jgi:hypothetical protein
MNRLTNGLKKLKMPAEPLFLNLNTLETIITVLSLQILMDINLMSSKCKDPEI